MDDEALSRGKGMMSSLTGISYYLALAIAMICPTIAARENELAVNESPHLKIDAKGASFVVQQRHSELVPGSDGSIKISLGDITGWMVLVSLKGKDSTTVLRETPMAAGEMVTFDVEDRKYVLSLQRLKNVPIGDDTAEFTVVQEEQVTKAMKRADARKKSRPQEIKIGGQIETNVSGALRVEGIPQAGSANLRSAGKQFTLEAGRWAWLGHDEIVKVTAVSRKQGTVTLQLYHPAPFPRPF